MEKITGFEKKNKLTLISLGWKYFKSLRDESDELIYTYKDMIMWWFVRQSMKGGRFNVFKQYIKSKKLKTFLQFSQKKWM